MPLSLSSLLPGDLCFHRPGRLLGAGNEPVIVHGWQVSWLKLHRTVPGHLAGLANGGRSSTTNPASTAPAQGHSIVHVQPRGMVARTDPGQDANRGQPNPTTTVVSPAPPSRPGTARPDLPARQLHDTLEQQLNRHPRTACFLHTGLGQVPHLQQPVLEWLVGLPDADRARVLADAEKNGEEDLLVEWLSNLGPVEGLVEEMSKEVFDALKKTEQFQAYLRPVAQPDQPAAVRNDATTLVGDHMLRASEIAARVKDCVSEALGAANRAGSASRDAWVVRLSERVARLHLADHVRILAEGKVERAYYAANQQGFAWSRPPQ